MRSRRMAEGDEEGLLLPLREEPVAADDNVLLPHHRPWRWRGARLWLTGFIFWLMYCETVRPRCVAHWGSHLIKGTPAWRLMLMVPTGSIVLPTFALLARGFDARGLTIEEWGEQWSKLWRLSFSGICPQTDFSWIFVGATTAMFMADFMLFPMSWPMKIHHFTSLGLLYSVTFLMPWYHPHALLSTAGLELGTALSNSYYLSGQSSMMKMPYIIGMTASNLCGFYLLVRGTLQASKRALVLVIPIGLLFFLMMLSREAEMLTVAVFDYSFSGGTDSFDHGRG